MQLNFEPSLIAKYDQPVPRYTSYPTVPFWNDSLNSQVWLENFKERFEKYNHTDGISLYIHLPFCESLCTYCGCNKKITTNHKVEEEYLQAIEKEWNIYRKAINTPPVIREIHLGGGTPTFFSPENLKLLLDTISKRSITHPRHEFSIEGHPNNTTFLQLKMLFNLGFRRISFGVQDNDPEVQRIINRIQPVENVKRVTEEARAIGFTSVNFDLIYGLPKQTPASMETTIRQVLELKPDRIAFYSYAHVPWACRAQRLFDEQDLPLPAEKLQLYILGKTMLLENGYFDIGMDHFALPHDQLYIARKKENLHRNFMGYTTHRSALLLGLGVSSISDSGTAFAQNHKNLHDYYAFINEGKLAINRGYLLSEEDSSFRNYILDVSCKGKVIFNSRDKKLLEQFTFPELESLAKDDLIVWDETQLRVTEKGHHFIRNICRAFDLHLLRNKKTGNNPLFSKAI